MNIMSPNYDVLCLANKVEIYRHIIDNTKGEDLQKVLWLHSPNSEIWLERRTTYTRSLATMSMVGYILGLGDRHPSNIMLQRQTGRIVHIDFGDCWEVTQKRDKCPEKIPFRLTRMLVKALEACGIEGNYRNTCEIVMQTLRENKESMMAVLEVSTRYMGNGERCIPSQWKMEIIDIKYGLCTINYLLYTLNRLLYIIKFQLFHS